jgi:hypothetical protein
MTLRPLFIIMLAAGVLIGSMTDRFPARAVIRSGEFVVLACDFHVHASPGDGALTPFSLRDEARRAGLDVIVISNHNQFVAPRLIPWLPEDPEAPLEIPGEEITHADYHLIALGIDHAIAPALPVPAVVAEIHAAGGVAIAAHPGRAYTAYDDAALASVDGSEVARTDPKEQDRREYVEAFERAKRAHPSVAPIGSSDVHMTPALGSSRTFVFARERSASGVLEAIRAGRTVAMNDRGEMFGDPSLVARVRANMPVGRTDPHRTWRRLAVALAWAGVAGLIVMA